MEAAVGAGVAYRLLRDAAAQRSAKRWVSRGRRFLESGETEQALVCCRKALTLFQDSSDACELMAKALMPGGRYTTLLRHLHEQLRPDTYLEIGVHHGDSLALAGPATKAVGIDPTPAIQVRITSRARLYPLTSDEFFERYDLLAEFGSPTLDFAFIDGLHEFKQALKDFINVERCSCPRTVVLLHDCLPVARLVAAPVRATYFWCGDGWKVVSCLLKYRPDLNVRVVPVRPSGLAIVTHLDADSTLLRDGFEEITSEYREQELSYEYLDSGGLAGISNVVPSDWMHICRSLASELRGA